MSQQKWLIIIVVSLTVIVGVGVLWLLKSPVDTTNPAPLTVTELLAPTAPTGTVNGTTVEARRQQLRELVDQQRAKMGDNINRNSVNRPYTQAEKDFIADPEGSAIRALRAKEQLKQIDLPLLAK